MIQSHDSEDREAPKDSQAKDPVFVDAGEPEHWLRGEIGTQRRAGEPPTAGNCRRPRVGVIRWCKRLVVGSVLLVLVLAAALIAAVWFSRGWLRIEGEKLLTSELARQRIHMDYGGAKYEFTRGLLLSEVRLYETAERDKLLLTCTELGFTFDVVGLLQNRLVGGLTTSFNTRGSTVVCYEGGQEVATIQNLRADIVGRPNDVLIDQFQGRIGDLDFELEGQILATREQRRKKREAEQLAEQTGKPKTRKVADFAFFRKLMPWLDVTSREEGVRPEIRAKFVVDHSAAEPVTVSGRFTGRNFNWRKVPLDSASVEFAFAEGDERLVLPAFNLVYQGGLITGAGVWHSGTNVATVERFQSAANILGLLRDINPKIAPFAATIQQDEPPLLNATGQLKIKDFWNSDLDIRYRHQSGMTLQMGGRPLRVEGINGQVHVAGGGFETESLVASILGGSFEFGGRAQLANGARQFRGAMSVQGLPLQAIVNHIGGKADLPGLLSGRFEGGAGTTMADLNGSGSLRIDAAKLYKVPVIGPVQNLMGSVLPVFGDAEKRSELTASFTVNNGVLDSRDLVILADGTRVEVGGTLNLSSWQTQFEAQGNLVGALGLVTGLLSKALVVEGSGRVDQLDLKLKHVPAEFASDTVRGVFDVAKGGVGVVSHTVGAGLEGAQNVAGGAIKATGNVLNGGADVVTDGVRAVGDGLGDGARMVGQGAKKLGEGLMKIIPGGKGRDHAERQAPPDPEPPKNAPVIND
jgi:hypothetical protein